MGKQHSPGRRSKKKGSEQLIDPLTGGEAAEGARYGPVDLEVVDAPRAHPGDFDVDEDDLAVEWGPDFDEDADDPADGPLPRLAAGPRHGPGHHPGPPHAGGPKKGPAKKVPGKKVPPKKAHGPKKHGPGHRPDEFGLGPDFDLGPGPGFGFGRDGRGHRRGPVPGRRSRPGDVRAAILTLLAEGPMHGYEMIQQIAERSQGGWRPSPGSVYPTLQLLNDEGLVVGSESRGSKKLFELTEDGCAAVDEIKVPPWEQFSGGVDPGRIDLHAALNQLFGAVTQAAYVATAEQQQPIVAILNTARRQIYALLAESE